MRRLLPLLACLAAVASAADAPTAVAATAAASADRGFAAGADHAALRLTLRDGRVYAAGRIAGRDLTLLVDPAGANVLSPKVAATLGLERDAAASMTAGTPAVRAATVELGGYVLRDALFYLVELDRWRELEGAPIDGVLGLEAFDGVVLTIDYAARLLTLTAPEAFRAPERAVRLPLRLVEGLPLVAARVDGMAGEFAIEPATRGPLTLHGGFVRQHELIDRYGHGHEGVVAWGLGGAARGYATRVGEFEWGGLSAPHPVAMLRTDERAAGSGAVAGSVGGLLLARFTVSFDFAGRALLLEPNSALGTPDAHDRAGLWLNLDGEDLIIDALLPNGPAARAQLQPHDRLVAVDGIPATQLTLAGLRERFATAPAGTRVRITARRDGKVIYAGLILADLVPTPIPAP
jgi:hypothetical protein